MRRAARGEALSSSPARPATASPVNADDASARLTPYVPRLVIDWLRDHPRATHRTVEGTLVFADISGFTRLSEALARRGKVGAELMRDTLNGVFTALLDAAYAYGAGLIKWGGDAVLLLFDEPGHDLRAARAAWEMQRAIDRVGRLRAPGGTVVLRMSVGLATGPIEFFLVGDMHRELLVAGPTATETVEMEALAEAGEIALSPRLAAALGLDPVAGPDGAPALLREPPGIARWPVPHVGDVSDLDITSCIPVATRAHVLLDRSEPEHRTITAAFIDLLGTDEALADLGAAALAGELDERLRTIQSAALRFEVPFYETDVGKGSIKALLTAGAPSSTGNDEERMLRALRAIVEAPGRIPVRVGVNTGRVFTGDFGPPYRRAYRVFGDAINTAARVMSRAEPGQVLATEAVLERSRTLFATTAVEPFAAKGKALPIHASVVGPVVGRRRTTATASFIGREPELATLLSLIEARRDGGWTIELSGRAGLGKSRLVEQVVSRLSEREVHRARGDEFQASTPYFPLQPIFRELVGGTPETGHEELAGLLEASVSGRLPHLLPWLPVLGIVFGLVLPPTPETERLEERFLRGRLAEVVFEFLSATLADRPALFLIEDAEFIDEATLDLLAGLERIGTERAGRSWITLLTSARPETLMAPADLAEDARWSAICLLPLTLGRARELVDQVSDERPLPPHVADAVARRSGGNVVFLFELLELAQRTRTLESLPDSIEALVGAEIDRLAPRDRDLLRYASVLGQRFDPELLATAVRDELVVDGESWRRLGELVEDDPAGGLRFRNPLTREAAYEGLPYRRRRQLHAWLGEAIEARSGDEAEGEAAALALHFLEAQDWARAWRYGRHAAERAGAVYANVEAEVMWERAIRAGRRLRPLDRRALAAALEALGDVRFRLGGFDAAATSYQAARRLHEPGSADAGAVALKEALIPFRLGNYPRTLRRLSRGLRGLEHARGRSAAASRARLCARYAAVRFRQNRSEEAIRWCLQAEREARRGQAPDALAFALMMHDMALLAQGRPSAATHSPRALSIYRELGDLLHEAGTLNNMGLIAYEQGRWGESLSLYEQAGAIWRSTGDSWTASFATYNSGEILSDQGRFDEAEQRLRDALRVWRASGAAPEIAQATRQLGRLAARRGNDESARRLLASARDQQLANGEAPEVLTSELWIAEAMALAGEGEQAADEVRRLQPRARELDPGGRLQPMLQRVLGWALLVAGADADAAEAFAAGLEEARARSAGFELVALLEGAVLAARRHPGGAPELEAELGDRLAGLGMIVRPAARLPLPAPA